MPQETSVQPVKCRLNNISKSFGNVHALRDVSLEVRGGEFLAIIGENGAGKSTAMGVLFGLLEPDSGHVEIDGEPRKLTSARDAIEAGFGMVHQHFKLYPELTVLENVLVGHEGAALIPFKALGEDIAALIKRFDFSLDLQSKVVDLPVDAQQQLEIVKMLYRGASVVILDEPTAILTPQEIKSLYQMLRQLRDEGTSIVLITHKLDEVMENSERILVMRQGELVAERYTSETDATELAELMVGREIKIVEKTNHVLEDVTLALRNVTVQSGSQKPVLDRVSFDLRAGEILGIAGITGNGQKELVNTLTGLTPNSAGEILFDGRDVSTLNVAQRRELGIGYMAEDRMAVGLAGSASIAENLISGREGKPQFSRFGFLQRTEINNYARRLVERFDIRTPSAVERVSNLSGGNQQKVIVARELSAEPKLLVVENPCWGVDVGAIAFIHGQILDLAERGAAIVLISSDLEELFKLSDRVCVMYEGRQNGMFERDELDAFAIGACMSGGKVAAA